MCFQSFEIFVLGIYVLRIRVFCYVAIDDDDSFSDGVFVNADSEDEFEINSQDGNNSHPLNDVEVLSSFDCVFSCTVV